MSYCDILIPAYIKPPTTRKAAITMRIIAQMGSSDLVTGAGAVIGVGTDAGVIGVAGANASGQPAWQAML